MSDYRLTPPAVPHMPEQPNHALAHDRRLFLRGGLCSLATALLTGTSNTVALANSAAVCTSATLPNALKNALSLSRGFQDRRTRAFRNLSGKPLQLPTFSKNPIYIRPQTYKWLSFALGCFWNNENITAANAAITAHNDAYLDPTHGEARIFGDSFYWGIGLLFECIELFGSNGTVRRNRLSATNERNALIILKKYADRMSTAANHHPSTIWDVWGTENHQVQRAYCLWHTMKLFAASRDYCTQRLPDGRFPKEHLDGWTAWFKVWIREHARRCFFVEYGGDEYNATTLKGLYVIAGFAHDLELKMLAYYFIEVFWATWIQEMTIIKSSSGQIVDFVRGGSKSRIYPVDATKGRVSAWTHQQHDPIQQLCFYYSGRGNPGLLEADVMMMVAAGVEPHHRILARLTEDFDGVPYETTERTLGFFNPAKFALRADGTHYVDSTKSFLRYTYRTPDYTLGSVICPALREWEWTMISSQNRWAGLVCTNHVDARVGFYATPTRNLRSYNAFWSVQKNSAMIAQKLLFHPTDNGRRYSKDTGAFGAWVSNAGRTGFEVVGAQNWVFVAYGNCWVAIGAPVSGFNVVNDTENQGIWIYPKQEYDPLVMEVSRAADRSFASFKSAILGRSPQSMSNRVFEYTSLDRFTLSLPLDHHIRRPIAWQNGPAINRTPVDMNPKQLIVGPYVQSDWNTGKITYRRFRTRLVYDFDRASRSVVD